MPSSKVTYILSGSRTETVDSRLNGRKNGGVCLRLVYGVMGCLALMSQMAFAQLKIQAAQVEMVDERATEKKVKENEEKYAGGAALKTDADLEDELKRASAFVAEKNYRNAAIIWDRVLQKSNNSLVTRDGETYVSLVREVEQTIRGLPKTGLDVYRISADGKARALMPGKPAEASQENLNKLVRLYFMSSLGDDAAFELGCRALDQRDFVSASRMFGKILQEHPDPSVDRNAALLRNAIATANLGDPANAKKIVESVENPSDVQARFSENVVRHIEFVSKKTGSVLSSGGDRIGMRLSTVERSGLMPDLPADILSGDLTQGYEFRFPYQFAHGTPDADLGKIIRGGKSDQADNTAAEGLSKKWRTEKWFPASQLLFAGDRIVLKTTNDLVCIDATAKSDLANWHSLWLNHFELDDASSNALKFRSSVNRGNTSSIPLTLPKDRLESHYFFDRIHHSMSVHNGIVYTIEGQNYSQLDETPPRTAKTTTTVRSGQPANLTRSRTNYLTAYNLRTGKVLWTRSAYEKPPVADDAEAEATEDTSQSRVGFLGTPIPFGKLLICPVTEGGSIFVYAMDASNAGKTVWKTFLCDDPASGVSLFSPVELTIDGQEAYVTCGAGVLFALNAATGNIHFARRYKRDGVKKKYQVSYNQHQDIHIGEGWDDDLVVTWRNALVVMASDHDYLFAIDRRSGRFLWDAPRIPFDQDVTHAYCLGHYKDRLYMATNKSVLCYSLAGDGKLDWYQKLPGNSFGRGFITSKAVYIPVENSVIKFDIQSGKKLAQVGVNLGNENKVGNLFSDGKQIWVVGLNRVVRLRSLRERLVELDKLIEQKNVEAVRERMEIHARLEEHANAIADAALWMDLEKTDKAKALGEILKRFRDNEFPAKAPADLLGYLDGLLQSSKVDPALVGVITTNYSVFFETAESMVANDKKAIATVLGWVRHAPTRGFRSSVGDFLKRNPPTFEQLKTVLEGLENEGVLTLIPVAARIPQGTELLRSLFNSPDEPVQLSAAREMALLGEKECLPTALKLLASDDPYRRSQALLILRNVSRQDIAFDPNAAPDVRSKAAEEWKKWLDANLESLKVSLPISLQYGRILVATASEVIEYSVTAGKFNKIYENTEYRPEDVATTPLGNRLICEYVRKQIVELDLTGKQIVKISTEYSPRSVRKLANGNYLVAWRNNSKPVVELDGKGRVVWSPRDIVGDARSAERLANGNTLITLINRVIEIDENSNVVYQLGQAQSVNNCNESRRLSNGNTLVVYGTTVAEFDKNKNRVMKLRGSISPKSVVRLADGVTLVAHSNGLRVFDKDGKRIDELVNRVVNSVWLY